MPPRKTQKKAPLPFPPATSAFKYSAAFRPYQRDSPPQYNQIPIPFGKNGCLSGISFVITGTLPSLKREQAKDLIEKYGGKLMSAISGKTDVLLRGVEEVGAKKVQEAESRGIQIIDQEGLFSFIENSNKSASAPPPAAAPPPVQTEEEPKPASKTKKGAAKKEVDNEKELEEKRIADILANLQKPTSSFTYFQGFQYGVTLTDDPPKHNQIPIPVGAFGCLKGLVFVQTGTLTSLTKDEAKDLIEKYGGTMAKTITKKTHILIRGCIDVGETKMNDAKKKKLPIIDQAGLFDIIERSNAKNVQQPQPQQEQKAPQIENVFSSDLYQSSLFSEKYRPRSMKDVVGNIGAINQLRDWIKNFKPSSKKKESKNEVKPIALISGPTGVGKTTSAHLVCSELGFSITEFNSSESRAKKFIEEISETTSNMSFSFDDVKVIRNKKNVIIFEDIEDMSRSYSNLIELAEKSKIPIICICNNIDDKKIEPLLKASLSIRFMQPKAEEIKKRLRFICSTEGIEISDESLDDIIAVSKHDVRFAINSIQYWCQWGEKAKESAVKDDVIDDIIEAVLTILTPTSQKDLNTKFDAFFFDYSQIPLYVQQNLPLPMKQGESIDKDKMKEYRHNYADALESICYGDLIDNCIQETQTYSLLSAQAVTSSIYPSELVEASVVSLSMPKLFGATKKQQKIKRYIQQIGERAITFSNQPKAEIYDTFSTLLNKQIDTFISKTNDYSELISFADSLGLTPDDFDHIEEICSYEQKKKKSGKFDSIMKDIMKQYKKKHSDDPKKLSSETDFRALHYVWQSAGKPQSIK